MNIRIPKWLLIVLAVILFLLSVHYIQQYIGRQQVDCCTTEGRK